MSIYLSHQGYKVANLPLIQGIQLPPDLDAIDQSKFVGLTIDPEALLEIRQGSNPNCQPCLEHVMERRVYAMRCVLLIHHELLVEGSAAALLVLIAIEGCARVFCPPQW